MHMGGGSFPGAKVASDKGKVPLVSLFSTRFVSRIPMYQVDSSSDVVRLNVRDSTASSDGNIQIIGCNTSGPDPSRAFGDATGPEVVDYWRCRSIRLGTTLRC